MTEKKDTPSVNNSIQTRLSGVMLMVLVFALGINFFIFSQIQNAVTRKHWNLLRTQSMNT